MAVLERRMSGELADLIRRHGGEPHCVPALREVTVDCQQQVSRFIDSLSQNELQIVIFLTGIGAATLFREAESLGRLLDLRSHLKRVTIVCRGPKPATVLRQQDIPVAISVREPYTTSELLEAIGTIDVDGKGVALMHYGERNQALAAALAGRGARLTELCLYEWLMPEDIAPLQSLVRAVINGGVDVVAFTSQIQVRHLFQVASGLGLAADLVRQMNSHVIVAATGPICAAALKNYGITPRVVPEHPKMGHLIVALGRYIEQAGPGLVTRIDPPLYIDGRRSE